MKKISVIFPVYNVEYDIKEALNSLLNQTIVDDIEVIMVDDGSTDHSKYIIDEYDANFENFYAYHKENGGLSSARNFGMQYAKGEYIHFFDSDDLIAYDSYEKLYEYAKKDKCDIVVGNFLKFNSQKTWAQGINEDIEITNLLNTPNLTWDMFAWNKIFRREFLEDNNITFYKENITFEDNLFSIEVYDKAEKIAITTDYIYFWRQREAGTSITQDYSLKRPKDLIKIFNLVKEYINENITEKEILEKKYLKWLIWDIPMFINMIKEFPEEEHEFLIEGAAEICDLIPSEFYENINNYYNTLYKIIRDRDLDNLYRFLSIDFKKNPEIPEDLDDKYKESLNFLEDAKGEDLDTYAEKVSKSDDEIIIKLNNHIPYIKASPTDEVYVKLVNSEHDDVIIDSEHFYDGELHIPIDMINPGENILITHYKSGEIEKEYYVKTNSRRTYSFDEFDINVARGMTSYIRLIKREKGNAEMMIDEINVLDDKIEFIGQCNERIDKVILSDILDLYKLSFPVECITDSDGDNNVLISIGYNDFLEAPIKKWEFEIDGKYNKVNVNEKHYFVNELYTIEIRNYGNKIIIEFERYDPIEKISEMNRKYVELDEKKKKQERDFKKKNNELKNKNIKLNNTVEAYKNRKVVKIVDKIQGIVK